MSRRPILRLLDDMKGRIERIERYVAGLDRAAFLRDEKTADSVVRNLEVIGEAAARLSEAFRNRHPDVPWRQIVGLRNRIVHAYFDVDLELVWQIVTVELLDLKVRIVALPRETGADRDEGDT